MRPSENKLLENIICPWRDFVRVYYLRLEQVGKPIAGAKPDNGRKNGITSHLSTNQE
jgi:hypothetical protein